LPWASGRKATNVLPPLRGLTSALVGRTQMPHRSIGRSRPFSLQRNIRPNSFFLTPHHHGRPAGKGLEEQ
jgi:hypothetical protein